MAFEYSVLTIPNKTIFSGLKILKVLVYMFMQIGGGKGSAAADTYGE